MVTVGKFTILHRGHRLLLSRLVHEARLARAVPSVVTFDRHPLEILNPARAPGCVLATLEQRLSQFADAGVGRVLVLGFTTRLARLSAEDFADLALVRTLHAKLAVVGPDFRFGRDRRGDADLLRRCGIEVCRAALVEDGHGQVSSTRIGELIRAGEVAGAAALAGGGYRLAGEVVHGAGRGRSLGFATANLRVHPKACLPAFGIYAGWWCWRGRRLPGAISVGMTPQFDDVPAPKVEVHVLGFDQPLYGESGEIEFVARLRGEQRFPDLGALTAQIGRDVAQVSSFLTGRTGFLG